MTKKEQQEILEHMNAAIEAIRSSLIQSQQEVSKLDNELLGMQCSQQVFIHSSNKLLTPDQGERKGGRR